jgi:hypothetical protein
MKDRIKLPFNFDVARLQQDMQALESKRSEWIDHFVTQNYEGNWSVIPLRGPDGATHPVQMIYSDPVCDTFSDTPFLKLCPYFTEVIRSFQCKMMMVRLMKLTSGSKIKEHRDYDLDIAMTTVRLHIPIITNDQVMFYLNKERVIMQEGECWYLRLADPHSVENHGADRVHMVLDMRVNDWLREQLEVSV